MAIEAKSPLPATRGHHRRGWCVWLFASAALAGWIVLLHVGCDEQRDYKTLSFFFDGVPVPGAATQAEGVARVGPEGAPMAGAVGMGGAGATGAAGGEPAYIEHAPFRNRQCNGCHAAGGMAVTVTAQAPMCGKCHAPYAYPDPSDWVHGPVALGNCGMCHEPHRSLNPGLLKKPAKILCADCHVPEALPNRPYHKASPAGEAPICINCHDPHMAGNRMLLADSNTYARLKHPEVVSTHKPFDERRCEVCHAAGGSNLIVANIDTVCLTCHGEMVKAATPGKLHQAVSQGHCVTCHDPHKSSRPHLIRPIAEKMCFACHKPAEIDKPSHPPILRADCLICHAGHQSDRPYLLRHGVPAPTGAIGSEPAKAGEVLGE